MFLIVMSILLVLKCSVSIVTYIIHTYTRQERLTALDCAAQGRHFSCIGALVGAGADIVTRDPVSNGE